MRASINSSISDSKVVAHSRSLSKHEHVLATATAAVRLYLAQLASSLQAKCEQICLEKLL